MAKSRKQQKIEQHIMWKPQFLALLALAACDDLIDDGGSTSSNPYPPLSVAAAQGQTFVPEGPSMIALNGYDPVTDAAASIEVVSATEIRYNAITLTADADGKTFRSGDGKTVVTLQSSIDGVGTDQILYALATETSGSETFLSSFVMGNATASGDLPTPGTGTATYAGKMTVFNDLGLPVTLAGPVLTVSLQTASVNGSFDFANTTAVLVPTTIVDGTFYTTLASTEASPVVTGTIDGTMFGANGEEIGGTLGLQVNSNGTPTESYVGYYGATTTP